MAVACSAIVFVTSEKTLYAGGLAQSGIDRREAEANAVVAHQYRYTYPVEFRMPIAEHDDTLYIVAADKIFASPDNGETWNAFCPRPKGHPVGFVVTNETDVHNALPHTVLYLALQDKGIFRSTDAGHTMESLSGWIGR